MPELPEVETVRLSLLEHIQNATVRAVTFGPHPVVQGSTYPIDLLSNSRLATIERRGKDLALAGVGPQGERAIAVHLGMSGSLRYHRPTRSTPDWDRHCHVRWQFADGSWMIFRDPRRFGGVWTYPDLSTLKSARWTRLGPDALTIAPAMLVTGLARTRRPIKAALLDQQLIAGLGNIYVDELLFACRVHPETPGCRLSERTIRAVVPVMKRILRRAIRAGGSSVRSYVDGQGSRGSFQLQHHVYGRGGQPCTRCRRVLVASTVGGRTTVYCAACQSADG